MPMGLDIDQFCADYGHDRCPYPHKEDGFIGGGRILASLPGPDRFCTCTAGPEFHTREGRRAVHE